MKKLILFLILFHSIVAKSQTVNWENLEWANDIQTMLSDFLSCGGDIPSNSPCNIFLGKALKRIYKIDDFMVAGTTSFLSANEIAGYVENDDKWTLLGSGNSQEALDNAQGYANLGKAVIAVQYVNKSHGHVCLIIPGNPSYSGDWKLNCPNSASFFLNKPKKSYVGQKLSYAFTDPTQVKIYGRNY